MKERITGESPSEGQIEQFVHAAQEYVRRSLHVALDVSEDSLAYTDQYIRSVRGQGVPKPEIAHLVASALGVHLGQVFLQKVEGHWYGPLYASAEERATPTNWRIECSHVPLSFSPVGMAWSVLHQEEDDTVDASVRTSQEWTPLLAQALQRLAPVTDDYYYSLTGKFETLLFAVELLAEIQQQSRKKQPTRSH